MRGLSVTAGLVVELGFLDKLWTSTRHSCTVTQRRPCCIPEQNTRRDASWAVTSAIVLLARCCLHSFLQHHRTFQTNLWFVQSRQVPRVDLKRLLLSNCEI